MLEFERQFWDKGIIRLAGVDEVGRGPLAGPVVAAAVIFERSFLEAEENGQLKGMTDSKKLSASRREFFYAIIRNSPNAVVGIGIADVNEIDERNILRATHLAMKRALSELQPCPEHVLIDGLPVQGLPYPSTAIVGGDSKSLSIAAASIVAKVFRDAQMKEMDALYPEYGFASHKGYGSKVHIQALLEYGPSPIHRKTFRPVYEAAGIRQKSGDMP